MPLKIVSLVSFLLSLLGCASSAPQNPYAGIFASENIRSILVVPAVNRSINIEAPEVLLTTLPEMLAEAGYYVFPVNTVKVVLEHEGLYEASVAHSLKPTELANIFEADSVLYITIDHWESKYILLKTLTQVTLSYRLVSRSGVELWSASKTELRDSMESVDSGNMLGKILVGAVNAAVQKAAPNYRPLAEEANREVFITGLTQLPDGPYLIEAREKD